LGWPRVYPVPVEGAVEILEAFFAFHISIAHGSCELPWRLVAQRTVRAIAVEVLAPSLERLAYIVQHAEQTRRLFRSNSLYACTHALLFARTASAAPQSRMPLRLQPRPDGHMLTFTISQQQTGVVPSPKGRAVVQLPVMGGYVQTRSACSLWRRCSS
jgi:hypothetical protein